MEMSRVYIKLSRKLCRHGELSTKCYRALARIYQSNTFPEHSKLIDIGYLGPQILRYPATRSRVLGVMHVHRYMCISIQMCVYIYIYIHIGKLTDAMRLVAAAKVRRAQDHSWAAWPPFRDSEACQICMVSLLY